MSQYPRFDMPTAKAPDVTGSLLDLARASAASSEMNIRTREMALKEDDRKKATADLASVDAAQAPVPDTTTLIRTTAAPAQPQVDAADTLASTQTAGAVALPGATRAPNRSEILSALPAHLRPVVQGQFDSADENARRAQKSILDLKAATRKATEDVNEHLAGLGYTIAQWQFDPGVARTVLDHAKETYKDDKPILDQINAIDQQIQADPSQVKTVALAAIGQSPKYTDLMRKEGATTELQLANTAANDPDPAKRDAAQKTLDTLAAHKRDQSPKAPKSLQSKSMLVDGKPAEVMFDPTGRMLDLDGNPIQNASTRVKPIPAASITIHNDQQKPPELPTWATDDTRPSGPEANTLDPVTRMTPNGLHQAALNYIANGQFPPTGRGSDPVAVAQRAAITSKVGAISAASGMDEPALRAFYKSNAASLTQQQKLFDSAQSNISTADRNVAELEKALAKMPDTGSPLLNQPLRSFSKTVMGNTAMSPIATYLASVQNEYGKIINSANGASGVLSDSARHEAQQLLDPNATVAQMLESIKALKTEGGNRLLSTGDQIKAIQTRMQAGASNTASAPTSPVAPAASGITVTTPSGKSYTFATQAEADAAVARAKAAGLWK